MVDHVSLPDVTDPASDTKVCHVFISLVYEETHRRRSPATLVFRKQLQQRVSFEIVDVPREKRWQ